MYTLSYYIISYLYPLYTPPRVRSQDFQTRILITFNKNDDKESEHYPYTLSFYNLALIDRDGARPVELKHR